MPVPSPYSKRFWCIWCEIGVDIDQSWMFFGRNDAKAETPVVWPSHAKSWLIGKDSDAGRDWGQEEKGTTGDEMAGWHHWLDGCEFEWTPGDGDGQGGLACCDSWGRKESDTTERLSRTELNWKSSKSEVQQSWNCVTQLLHLPGPRLLHLSMGARELWRATWEVTVSEESHWPLMGGFQGH